MYMAENAVVSVTNNHIYWDGAYSRCHVGGPLERYVRESLQRIGFPTTVVLSKADGFLSRKYYGTVYPSPAEELSPVLPSETTLVYLESLRRPATYPIVAALCSRGVERSNLLYLPLDDETFEVGLAQVLRSIPSPAWEDRLPLAFWRGGASGLERPALRVRVAQELDGYPHADVRITPWGNWESEHAIPPHLLAPRCDLATHFRYKYIFILDGNCIASNHQWAFGSGAVPIMITHPENRYWFQSYLKPKVNYVPVKYDLSDLKETLTWLRENDAQARAIAEAALALSKEIFSPEFQRAYIDRALATIAIGTPSPLVHRHLKKCLTPSDINEHLATLYAYTKRCTSVVECGVREIVSSYSFAAGLVGTPGNSYTMIDLYKSTSMDPFLEMCAREHVNARFLKGSDTECEPIETDLLFIDTWHVYGHLKRELAHWHSHVRKYILLHDTTVDEVYGESIRAGADTAAQSRESGYPEEEIRRGLGPAVTEFLEAHPEWVLEKKYTHNNGLTVLARK